MKLTRKNISLIAAHNLGEIIEHIQHKAAMSLINRQVTPIEGLKDCVKSIDLHITPTTSF